MAEQNNEARSVQMEDIIKSTFGETGSQIRATFKKTVLVRQYETEVVEIESTINLDKEVSGAERLLMSAILQAQLEYEAYCQLHFKGLVTQQELASRRKCLEEDVNYIKQTAEYYLGKNLDGYFSVNPT